MGRGLDGYLISVHWHCVVLKARERRSLPVSGGYGEGETPLPIPNRAVKPLSADGTWPARAWESRSPPVLTVRGPPLGGPSSWGGERQLVVERRPHGRGTRVPERTVHRDGGEAFGERRSVARAAEHGGDGLSG